MRWRTPTLCNAAARPDGVISPPADHAHVAGVRAAHARVEHPPVAERFDHTIWVGRFLGEDALAATSNANLIMFLMFAGVFGFGMAATILVGQNVGRRDMREARRALGTAIGGFVGIAIVIAVVGWIYSPNLLRMMATPGEAMPLALAYLRVIFLGMPSSS